MEGLVLFVFGLVAASAYPSEDVVISKLDPGLRYQYVTGPAGPRLVDLWLKTSDLRDIARYNPDVDIGYHLFTRSNPLISQPLSQGQTNILRASNFDITKRTIVLVHGWLNTPLSDFNVYLVHAFLAADDVNVIMVDWSIGAAGNYNVALMNNINSGLSVARFITWLNAASGARLSQYHLVGHSLGGHQVGIIGRNLLEKVPYITSLDPALPGWITNPHRFTKDDGIYTEVMHTDVGMSGIITDIGDVDFYPNGGRLMPGCDDRSCDHHKCIFFFAESLVYGGFTGRGCDSFNSAITKNCTLPHTLNMGGLVPKTGITGIYYLETNAEWPFSQG